MSAFLNTVKISLSPNFRLLMPYRNIHFTSVKHLYSPAAIGVDNYVHSRKKIQEQFSNFSDKFRAKMNDFVSDPKNMIFTEDLKNMVHMAEPSDLDLVVKMVKKFNSQSSEFRFGSFIFGPVIMRMFHFLDAPEQALQSFNDPANDGFFDQLVSFQILLDLLYIHEKYDQMFEVFEKVKEKQINMSKYPKYPVVLILAACYKQNTPQSLEYASKLWTDMINVGTVPLRRATTFFAALALKQGAPHIALEAISMQRQHYVTVRNIKALALADMGRVDDALPVLKQVLDVDRPDQQGKHTFFNETVDRVRAAAEMSKKSDIIKQFQDIEKALKDRDLIDQQSLDQLLNTEIMVSKSNQALPGRNQTKQMPFGLRKKNLSR